MRTIRRYLCALLRFPIPSQYVCHQSPHSLKTGYILLDYIEPSVGTMLSNSWKQHMGDLVQRENLFRGLARIILSMARLPLPQVGSFRFHDDGTLTLTPGRTLPGEISEERSPKRDLPGAPGRTLIGFKLSSTIGSICIHN